MSRVILIHPGTTDFDDQARIQGALDLPMNNAGLDQVREMIPSLNRLAIEAIYCAPEGAARQTADMLGSALGVRVKPSEELRNLNQGLWQGQMIDEVRRKYPRVIKQWEESPETICPPEGETVSKATERLKKALQKPLARQGAIAIVAPHPAASLIRHIITGDPLNDACPLCSGRCGAGWEDLSVAGLEAAPRPADEIPVAERGGRVHSLASATPGASH